MSYTALYRKFRPSEFSDVKGQDHIVTTLKNQINADRIGHAYLFCGTRGTGKTTVAKIFAKAVNCEHPVDGNPCGECASCRAIAAGTSMNQEVMDLAAVAHLSAIKGRVPFLNFFDGFRTSHEIQKVAVWDFDDLAEMCDMDAVQAFRDHALNPAPTRTATSSSSTVRPATRPTTSCPRWSRTT